ncbi:MAG: Trk system potassium transporter TrkA [Lachnospiraceae bacterium]|nr:Trk system potassium transporter TrkA [Lachnospiraceae bacterium]
MKIIIIGAGRTGCALIKALAEKNYDITVVEKQKSIVDTVTDRYNVSGIVGSGASKETLYKAGADTADVLIALTPVDEVNILSCMQAKAIGTLRTCTRVFQPDFAAERKQLETDQGIDYVFNPKYDISEEAAISIGLPGIVKPEGVFGNRMQMVSVTIKNDSPIVGKTLFEVKKELNSELLICTVLRDGKLIVPDGKFTIESEDIIGLAACRENLFDVLNKIGIVRKKTKKVMIVGGSVAAEYLIEMLLKDKKNITLIESDIDRCSELMEKYPDVNVSYGSGELADVLENEHIASMDAVVSLTDNDEMNMVTSMYAWSRNVPSVITSVDAPEHLKLLHRVNLDITLSSSEISVYKLIRFIRNCEVDSETNEIEKYATVADNKAEVLQFSAGEGFKGTDKKFCDPTFKLKKNIIIASIIHNEELVIPNGSSVISKGDKVIIVSEKKNGIERLNDIFED